MKPLVSLQDIKGKKALVFGLGLLGGGVATTNWLLRHGARVTVTDLKTKEELTPSLKKIRGKVRLALGGHTKKLIRDNDLVVVNPDVSARNEFIRYALKLGKRVENEATLFYALWQKSNIGVTGTRGKTTTVNWTNHFLKVRYRSSVAGNSPQSQFLKILDRQDNLDAAVIEVSSFHLELFGRDFKGPDVVVITNVYQDHLNRHQTMHEYALAKANLFRFQKHGQHLVLNYDNAWTKLFLKRKPQSHVWFFSARALPRGADGLFYKNKNLWFQVGGWSEKIFSVGDFVKERGEHNLENLLASALAARLTGVSWAGIKQRIPTLLQIPFRQEVIFKSKRLAIINDTTATSPDGAIAAARRFAGSRTVLIAGGTDRKLDFREWGRTIPRYIKARNLILLSGSATDKMLQSLPRRWHAKPCETLAAALEAALGRAQRLEKAVVLFSPGAKSFEKFQNEYDRGRKFNRLVRKEVRRRS